MTVDVISEHSSESISIFQSNLPINEKLEQARTELLDLTARNRLLNMPKSSKSTRSIEIVDERSVEIFRMLVRESKTFTFASGKSAAGSNKSETGDEDEITDLAQPEDEDVDDRGVSSRHVDTKLQTRLTPKGLQKRLLDLYFDSRTLEEEQGVNILFLTLGALKYVDQNNSSITRYAPLVLVPVFLERGNAGEKFKLRARLEDFAVNLSLEAFLDRVHGLRLPAFEPSDGFDLDEYMDGVAATIGDKAEWAVLRDDMVLGFFSFAKFLMYRDLDPQNWPEKTRITDRQLVRGLLTDGFDSAGGMVPEDAKIDAFIPPAEMIHIVDSDSSQALAVHEVRRGQDLVIQGPPGTGKSQTIANIVASAIADGKTVLFVAEKMAALEVVKRRLDATGVGDACLELHSNKANKRAVLDELRRTWELGAPKGQISEVLHARLAEARDNLNGHAVRMHAPHPTANLTPYQVVGHLTRLRLQGEAPNDIRLEDPELWSSDGLRERHGVVSELASRIEVIGRPADHAWRGVGLEFVLPTEVERLMVRIKSLAARLESVQEDQGRLAGQLQRSLALRFCDMPQLVKLADRVAHAPALTAEALGNPLWSENPQAIETLLAEGHRYQDLLKRLSGTVKEAAWNADAATVRAVLGELPAAFSAFKFSLVDRAAFVLPKLRILSQELSKLLGLDVPATLAENDRLIRIAEAVAISPPFSSDAFSSTIWHGGTEAAADLAAAVAAFERAKSELGTQLSDAAWNIDLKDARITLAAHGDGFLRQLSSDWRRANRLVRSILSAPDQPLDQVLPLLDALARGQEAKQAIERDDSLGRAVFGIAWRGERSASGPLLALVAWMQATAALPAARSSAALQPQRDDLMAQAPQLRLLVDEVRGLLAELWTHLGDDTRPIFGDAGGVDRCDVAKLHFALNRFGQAAAAASAMLESSPSTVGEQIAALDLLVAAQASAKAIVAGGAVGRHSFGSAWQGIASNWLELSGYANWIVANEDIRPLVAGAEDRSGFANSSSALEAATDALINDLRTLFEQLQMSLQEAFNVSEIAELPIVAVGDRLKAWIEAGEQLSKWVAYRDRANRGRALGCADIVERLADGRLRPAQAAVSFEMAYYEAIYRDQVARDPELGRFDGTLHSRSAAEFADLDQQRIRLASIEVARSHHRRIPNREGGAIGPVGVLRAEMQKKRGYMPIRRLMERAGPAIQALKPVIMMSPLSVAQFLAPGALEFDLLVMDEASQIQPIDALGAVARSKQVVVVGDPKQLPPTAFFSKVTGGGTDEDDDDTGRVGDIESILGLFTARGLPTRMLRWHYRSRHQSLIAVSNRQFYESKLFIVPSPFTAEAGMGLRFHHVSDGLFDAGSTRTNPTEAKIVAEAIVQHAREHANLSLGVAAFSAAQRRAILDQLELLRRTLPPDVEAFFQSHYSEPFFVKNLENIQGDERDVIFISVGYGPTTTGGRVPMRFGPLGSEGGERRLNVLISRAKQRCEVFASMTDEDIDPDFASSRKGVFAFRLFLHYARTGRITMAESTGRDHDSVFEEQVARALQARGYQVHAQVGLAGFFIDLAVADLERPGRYLLGIECDGAAYHSARSARDRDRLRQSVLESHGWMIHRIWSTDWFQRPAEQLDLVVAKIEAAKHEYDLSASRRTASRAVPVEVVSVEHDDFTEMGLEQAKGTVAQGPAYYVEAALERPAHCETEIHETPIGILTALVEQAVDVEGPVHVDEVISRLRDAWGVKRAGGRIQEVVRGAARIAIEQDRIVQTGEFLSMPDRVPVVRDRSQVNSQALRRAEMLPPAEISVAVLDIVRVNLGATADQIVQAVSRALGIKVTSAVVRNAILSIVEELRLKGELVDQAGVLTIPV